MTQWSNCLYNKSNVAQNATLHHYLQGEIEMNVQTTSGQALPQAGVVTLIAALHDADQNTIHIHRFTGEVTEAIIAFVIYLYFSRMVSLSSILVCFTAIFLSFFFKDWPLTIVTILLTVFIIYRHRSNIYRIKNGTESKVPFGYKSKSVKE